MKENCFTFLEWSQLENVYRWEIGLLRRMWAKERTWSDTISASAFCMHSPFGGVLIMMNSSTVGWLTNSSLDAAKTRPPTTFKGRRLDRKSLSSRIASRGGDNHWNRWNISLLFCRFRFRQSNLIIVIFCAIFLHSRQHSSPQTGERRKENRWFSGRFTRLDRGAKKISLG